MYRAIVLFPINVIFDQLDDQTILHVSLSLPSLSLFLHSFFNQRTELLFDKERNWVLLCTL